MDIGPVLGTVYCVPFGLLQSYLLPIPKHNYSGDFSNSRIGTSSRSMPSVTNRLFVPMAA